MYLHESRGRDYQKRREATWVAVTGYGHLAPGRLAMDEQRERIMTEAAHGGSSRHGQRLANKNDRYSTLGIA